MVIRQRAPINFEFPFETLDSFVTPADAFYIRSHFPAPALQESEYRLHIGGAVGRELSFSLDELRAMPAETVTATLECAGNSRVFLVPQVEGAQWGLGAVGNAAWTGVPLRLLLERASLQRNACEVIFTGADQGMPKEKPTPPSAIPYARSLPIAKALRDEVLVAYLMNEEPLSPDHGYPVRLIVPGHYGMASVKWLTSLHVVEQPFQGYWQTSDYGYWDDVNGNAVRKPLGEIAVKSQIARPQMYEVVKAGTDYRVTGAAWCGEGTVASVEITTDGGTVWAPVRFLDEARTYAWRRWEFVWRVPTRPQHCILAARATDTHGVMQPGEHDPNYGSYVINFPLPIEVLVR